MGGFSRPDVPADAEGGLSGQYCLRGRGYQYFTAFGVVAVTLTLR